MTVRPPAAVMTGPLVPLCTLIGFTTIAPSSAARPEIWSRSARPRAGSMSMCTLPVDDCTRSPVSVVVPIVPMPPTCNVPAF